MPEPRTRPAPPPKPPPPLSLRWDPDVARPLLRALKAATGEAHGAALDRLVRAELARLAAAS